MKDTYCQRPEWAANLAGIMFAEHISQVDIAAKLGCSRSNVNQIMAGKILVDRGEQMIRDAIDQIRADRGKH